MRQQIQIVITAEMEFGSKGWIGFELSEEINKALQPLLDRNREDSGLTRIDSVSCRNLKEDKNATH